MLSSSIGAAKEITVNTGGSIQTAVNSASSGDTIIVSPGNYSENIEITRANLELRSASGNPDDTIIASNAIGKNVISVVSNRNIKVKGFTISGATGATSSGISLGLCNGCIIENNKFLNNNMGIYVSGSENTVVRNNTITNGTSTGIHIWQSDLNTISGNQVSGYGTSGIRIARCQGTNTISGNNVIQNSGNGVSLEDTYNQVLESNTVSSNGKEGINLARSNNNNLKNNIVSYSGNNGIRMEYSSGNTVLNNEVLGNNTTGNNHGIFLYESSNGYVQGNTVSECEYGIALRNAVKNSLINNNVHHCSSGVSGGGFYVAYGSTENILSGNKANSNKPNGITLTLGSHDNVVDGNELNSNNDNGILIETTNLLETTNKNKISNNAASDNNRGIFLRGAGTTQNTLSNNILSNSKADGIRLDNSSENDLINNTISLSNTYGICLVGSSCRSNELKSNTMQSNNIGAYLGNSTENMLSENMILNNPGKGILFSYANNNNFSRNKVQNSYEGISFDSSESNTISGNNIISNMKGIYMCPRSFYNLVYNNCFINPQNADVKNNRSYWNITKTPGRRNVMGGPTLGGNFWGTLSGLGFSETNPDDDEDGIIDKTFVTNDGIQEPRDGNGNIIDYYPLKRVPLPVVDFNADTTKGFAPLTVQFTDRSQDATSWSWDFGDGSPLSTEQNPTHTFSGVGTYTVTLTAGNKYGTTDPKAMQIIVQKYTILPVANFNANPTSGYAPLSVQFTDLSQYATSRNWNFGDGATSTDQNPTHTYSAAGTYTVSLNAINENGTSLTPKTATITVTQQSSSGSSGSSSGSSGSSSGSSGSSSGSSGSSGGGGAGGSPEPAKNVQVKELSQAFITNGKPVKFDFPKEATCVVYVGFDSKKTAGKTTTIAEQLKGKSTLVSELNAGEVYKYFNVWVGTGGFATSKNIENPVVCFKVEKSWLQDKNIDQASITLSRYSDKKWSQLPVKFLKEDNKYLYFTAETQEFSFFAITGKAVEKETVTELKPETNTSKPEQNNIASDIEQKQKSEQETGKDKSTSIPGFEAVYVVACLLMVFRRKRK